MKKDNTLLWLILLIVAICAIAYYNHAGVIHIPDKINLPSVHVSGSVQGYITQTFGVYAFQALSVARCESGLNPSAYNPQSIDGSNATGVFQILYPSTWNTTSYAASDPTNAQNNIDAAWQIFQRDGYSWREWQCKP